MYQVVSGKNSQAADKNPGPQDYTQKSNSFTTASDIVATLLRADLSSLVFCVFAFYLPGTIRWRQQSFKTKCVLVTGIWRRDSNSKVK